MKRYRDKFYIQPVVETRQGSDLVYSDDPVNQEFVFKGSIVESFDKPNNFQGDMSKVTHVINCKNIDFELQNGLTVVDMSDESEFEIIFFKRGQKNVRIWVASI